MTSATSHGSETPLVLWNQLQCLGRAVEDEYWAKSYNEACFGALAEHALLNAGLDERTALEEAFEWLMPPRAHPQFANDNFGDLSVVVYRSETFMVQVLFWVSSPMSIHQHSFSGAFEVLAGSSIHARYRFDEDRRINSNFRVGSCRLEEVELLTQGEVRRIESGAGLTHGLYHLERPSISVVIRTHHEPWTAPQLTLYPPRIALGQQDRSEHLGRLVQVMRSSDYSGLARFARTQLCRLAPEVLVTLYPTIRGALREPGSLEDFHRAVETVHAGMSSLLVEYDRTLVMREHATRLRGTSQRVQTRRFMALAANSPDQQTLLSVLRRFDPARDPTEQAIDGICDLDAEGLLRLRSPLQSRRQLFGGALQHYRAEPVLARLRDMHGVPFVDEYASAFRDDLEALHRMPVLWCLWPNS